MKPTALSILTSFIRNHTAAWEALAHLCVGVDIVDFGYNQDKGSWIATDVQGRKHAFRMYRDACVGLISPCGIFIFQGVEKIFCGELKVD